MLVKLTTIAALVSLMPISGFATEIRQRPFSYSFDAAIAQSGDTFVVCSDCPDDKLNPMPAAAKVAVRLSGASIIPVAAKSTETGALSLKKEQAYVRQMLGSIHFQFDSASLTRHEQDRLEKLSEAIPAGKTVDVAGYTCTVGTDEYNNKLSFRRAQTVAAFLKAKGVTIGTIEGKGKCCPASQDKRHNRRVEITGPRKEEM